MKKIIIALLSAMCLMLFVFAGCSKPSGDDNNSQSVTIIALNRTSAVLGVNESVEFNLIKDDEEVLASWRVENDCIMVEDGVVTAKKLGDSKVFALYDGKEYSATVSVVLVDSIIPQLQLNQTDIEVFEGKTYFIEPSLTFKGEPIDFDGQFFVEYDSQEYFTVVVKDGFIQVDGLKLTDGKQQIIVTCRWNEILLTEIIWVEVKPAAMLVMNQPVISLYAFAYEELKKDTVVNATLYVDNEVVEGVDISYAMEDGLIASVDATGKVVAENIGETFLNASCVYNGEIIKAKSAVCVNKTIIDYPDEQVVIELNAEKAPTIDFSNLAIDFDGDLEIYEQGNDDTRAVATYKGACVFEIGKGITGGKKTLVFEKENVFNICVNVEAINKIIKTKEELQKLYDYADKDETRKSYSGIFYLGANIDMQNGILTMDKYQSDDGGFEGLFDGQGYTISNGKYQVGGLFGVLGTNGVVQNVAFTNCNMYTYSFPNLQGVYPGIIAGVFHGVVDNVLVDVVSRTNVDGAWGQPFGYIIAGARFSNIVAYCSESTGIKYFSYGNCKKDAGASFLNVYFMDALKRDNPGNMWVDSYYLPNITGEIKAVTTSDCTQITMLKDYTYWDLSGIKAKFKKL